MPQQEPQAEQPTEPAAEQAPPEPPALEPPSAEPLSAEPASEDPASSEPAAVEPVFVDLGDTSVGHEGLGGTSLGGELGEDEASDTAKAGMSRRMRLILGGVLAVGLAGAAVAGTYSVRIVGQKDATITTPEQVGALRRDNGAEAQSTAEYLSDALSAEVKVDKAVGAVYTDPARADRSVLFFGGTTLLWNPERDLDTAFSLIADSAGAVTGLKDVPAGEFGGTMRCGTTASSDGDIAVCGWADHGSLALAMFPSWTPADAAPVFLAIRNAAQSRS